MQKKYDSFELVDVIKKVLLKACVTVAPKLTLHAPVHKPTLHTFLVHPATLAMITRVKDPSEWEFAVPAAIIHQSVGSWFALVHFRWNNLCLGWNSLVCDTLHRKQAGKFSSYQTER